METNLSKIVAETSICNLSVIVANEKSWRENRDRGKSLGTHIGAEGASLVTQADAAVQEDVSVLSLEQEEERSEASPVGRAAFIHCHLATVSRTSSAGLNSQRGD